MLKFLTHKLKNHSINEDTPVDKVEDQDHDSGTESDDEQGANEEPEISDRECRLVCDPSAIHRCVREGCEARCHETRAGNGKVFLISTAFLCHSRDLDPFTGMESEGGSVITTLSRSRSSLLTPASPYFLDSALPSDCDLAYDLHSSEEELEVINSSQPTRLTTGQEKRKWSQVTPDSVCRGQEDRGSSESSGRCEGHGHNPGHSHNCRCRTTEATSCCSASSDDEVVGLVAKMAAPVQFRTSPPRGTHRPHIAATHEPSPRKRHRNAAPPRPCLDFEKMQQLQARAVSAWRHTGEPGAELSVYCW